LPKHTLRATMKIPAPPSPPTLNSSRNVSTCKRKHEALAGGSFSVRSSNRAQRDPQHRGSSAIAHFSRRKPVVVQPTTAHTRQRGHFRSARHPRDPRTMG
jgi:hypothetical protein